MLYDIEVLNPNSNIAISTLWTKKEYILKRLKEIDNKIIEKIGIIGTTYTSYGINFILESLGKYPNINKIILYGADLSDSGDSLIKLFGEKKLDNIKLLFQKEKIKKIVDTINVIDLREDFKKGNIDTLIKAIIENYNPNTKIREVINLKIEEKAELRSWPIPLSGLYIYDTSIFRAWIKILDAIMRFGSVKFSEYEEPQKEYLNVMVTIGLYGREYKLEPQFFEWLPPESFEKHVNEVFSPDKPQGVHYTYGERLFNYRGKINQIEYIIKKLSKSPYSRRAIAVLFDPEKDEFHNDIPCITVVQGEITDNYYNHTVYLRSNDMFAAWPINIYGQIKLAEYIVSEINKRVNTNFELGTITTISSSAHIYQHDWDRAREVLSKYSDKIFEFVEDPKGNYLIYHNKDSVIIEHRTPDHLSLVEKIQTKNFWEAYMWLKNDARYSLYQHAVYIGKEINRAFEKLRNGEKYIQDEA